MRNRCFRQTPLELAKMSWGQNDELKVPPGVPALAGDDVSWTRGVSLESQIHVGSLSVYMGIYNCIVWLYKYINVYVYVYVNVYAYAYMHEVCMIVVR